MRMIHFQDSMKSTGDHSDHESRIIGLNASGPYGKLSGQLALFGQFIGDWDILERRYKLEDGTWRTTKGELHWGWILGGRAMQDVWTAYDETAGELDQIGTTIRFYDPERQAWKSTWISPLHGTVMEFEGRAEGSEIVLVNRDGKEVNKWIFYEIRKDSFLWRSEVSADGGEKWATTMEMKIRRQSQSNG